MCKQSVWRRRLDLELQHSVISEHKLTCSVDYKTFSALHLIARQLTRFEVSFNLEDINFSDLMSLTPKRRTAALQKLLYIGVV